MAEWASDKIFGSSFITHNTSNGYEIHFATPDMEKYLAVQEECRRQIDHAKSLTNADKIKQANNESEIASAFIDFLCSVPCIGGKCKTPDKTCHQCVLDWLKSEKGACVGKTYTCPDTTPGCPEIQKALYKLAAYEDTGLTPEEITDFLPTLKEWRQNMGALRHVHELVTAEAEGRLLVLPCKVGDTVWSATPFVDRKIRAGNIVEINIDSLGFCGFWASFCHEAIVAEFIKDNIGKTVFQNREEAEAKLKEFGE